MAICLLLLLCALRLRLGFICSAFRRLRCIELALFGFRGCRRTGCGSAGADIESIYLHFNLD